MSVLGDKDYEDFIKNKYLPFYNSLNEKEKTFWLECSKETLIDHLIANINNGEKLLERINKAIEYLKEMQNSDLIFTHICEKELLEILGDKENE